MTSRHSSSVWLRFRVIIWERGSLCRGRVGLRCPSPLRAYARIFVDKVVLPGITDQRQQLSRFFGSPWKSWLSNREKNPSCCLSCHYCVNCRRSWRRMGLMLVNQNAVVNHQRRGRLPVNAWQIILSRQCTDPHSPEQDNLCFEGFHFFCFVIFDVIVPNKCRLPCTTICAQCASSGFLAPVLPSQPPDGR